MFSKTVLLTSRPLFARFVRSLNMFGFAMCFISQYVVRRQCVWGEIPFYFTILLSIAGDCLEL